ncbi:MAG: hypothetical protein WAO21_03470 [Verrucomicrobiia bacterium]
MNPKLAVAVRIGSALVATFVACVLLPLLAPGNQKHAPAFVMISAVAATCAGWIHVGLKARVVGLIHGTLMLLVGGYLLAVGMQFFLNSPSLADNAAAGVIAAANLVLVVFGALTLASGIGVILSSVEGGKP